MHAAITRDMTYRQYLYLCEEGTSVTSIRIVVVFVADVYNIRSLLYIFFYMRIVCFLFLSFSIFRFPQNRRKGGGNVLLYRVRLGYPTLPGYDIDIEDTT